MSVFREVGAARSGDESGKLQASKQLIQKTLIGCVKEIQAEHLDPQNMTVIETNELSAGLVNSIEALFIHGLNDSFTGRRSLSRLFSLAGAVDGVTSDRRTSSSAALPKPNFWTFVMIFSHRETLKKLDSFTQLNTDVGRSRAWVRMSLNDGLLSNYLAAMSRDTPSRKRHYKKGSLLRDNDALDVIARYLSGIQVYRFNLVLNSGLLNSWQLEPLVLSGLAHGQPRNDFVMTAIDAASTLDDDEEDNGGEVRVAAELTDLAPLVQDGNIQYIKDGLLNEDEALKMILRGHSELSSSLPKSEEIATSSSDSKPNDKSVHRQMSESFHGTGKQTTEAVQVPNRTTMEEEEEEEENEDSIYSPNFVSKSFEDKNKVETFMFSGFQGLDGKERKGEAEERGSSSSGGPDDYSRIRDGDSVTTTERPIPCLSGFVDSWNPFGVVRRHFDTPPQTECDDCVKAGADGTGFTLRNNEIHIPGLSVFDLRRLYDVLGCLPCDDGLDAQSYECVDCTRAIGTLFGPAKQCGLTMKYYCRDCHKDDLSSIPARILTNWDFTARAVSKKASMFLRAMSAEPIVDVSQLCQDTVEFAKNLKEIMWLRKKLKFMNAYLTTCASKSQPRAKLVFSRILSPKKHLYKEEHAYSLDDLHQVHSGKLKAVVQEAVKFARNHIVKECVLCSGRGFFCEKCRLGPPIYPFDLDHVKQCQKCFAVFHIECSESIESCPKCDRLEARNLNWHISLSNCQRTNSPTREEE